MDSKKLPYTQIPNIFFDTCQLHETAQILFLRLYRHLYNPFDQVSETFTGSVRKLANLLRMSKSTVDRRLKELEASRLITVHREKGSESDREVMVITINAAELWALNAVVKAGCTVPIWDKKLPVPTELCPNLGQFVPNRVTDDANLGHDDSNLGQTVPGSSSKSSTITTNNLHTEITKNNGPFLNQIDEITDAAKEVSQSLRTEKYEDWCCKELHTVYADSHTQLKPFLMEVRHLIHTFQYLPPSVTPDKDLNNFVNRLRSIYNLEEIDNPAAMQA